MSAAERQHELGEAEQFAAEVQPVDDVDYKWLTDYARLLWEDHNKTFAALDDKAENVVKFLGGGTGLLAIGILARTDANNWYVSLYTLPAVLCSLLAIYLAMRTKGPMWFPRLPSVKQAKTYADHYGKEGAALGAFLGQWHLACERAAEDCETKAGLLKRSLIASYVSLALLLLPILVALWRAA